MHKMILTKALSAIIFRIEYAKLLWKQQEENYTD